MKWGCGPGGWARPGRPWVRGRIRPLKPVDDVRGSASQAGLGLQLQSSGQGEGRARLGQEVIGGRPGRETREGPGRFRRALGGAER